MRINHNIAAIKTYNQLNKNQLAISKTIEKLSSGLRINRAADDATNDIYSYVFGINTNGLGTNYFNQSDDYNDFADEIFTPINAEDIANSISPGLANKIVEDTGFGGEQELAFKPFILQVGSK